MNQSIILFFTVRRCGSMVLVRFFLHGATVFLNSVMKLTLDAMGLSRGKSVKRLGNGTLFVSFWITWKERNFLGLETRCYQSKD